MMRRHCIALAALACLAGAAHAQSPDSLPYEVAMDLRLGGAIESTVRTVAPLSGGSTRSTASLREVEFIARSGAGSGIMARYETGSLPPGLPGEPTTAFNSIEASALIGVHAISVVAGYQFRETPIGDDKRLGLGRVGLEFGRRAEAIGVAIRASGVYMRTIVPTGSDSLQADGIDAETHMVYSPRQLPVYVDLGYRRQTMNFWRSATGGFRREESSKLILGIGLAYGLAEK